MKKRRCRKVIGLSIILLLTLGTAFSLAWTGEATAAPQKIRLAFGGATTGTWIYMFCALVAEIWQKHIPELDITVLATPGTTANYLPMCRGELDIAGAGSSGDWYAMNGLYFSKEKLHDFCSLLPATTSFTLAFTFADSSIKSWKDLEDKKVNVGARASPTSIRSEETCKALGIKPKYVFSTPQEAVEMVKDRRVDAMIYNVGNPWSGLMDIATTTKVRILAMTPAEQKKAHEGVPYQVPGIMPAKTYSFQDVDIPGAVSYQTVNVRPGLPDDLVYKLCKVIWEHWDEVVKASPAAKWVKPQDIANMVAPIHPGAAKYYKEAGVQIPDNKIWKKR